MIKVIIVVVSIAIGSYVLLSNLDESDLPKQEREKRRIYRYIGIAMLCGAIILGIYSHGYKKHSAQMPNDCAICDNYIRRKKNLRPYSTNEYQLLKNHATSCHTCSNMCFDYIQLMEKYPPTEKEKMPEYRRELSNRKKSCLTTTQYAIKAKKDLDLLSSKIRGGQARAWAVANEAGGHPTWSPFPEVPK